MSTVPVPDPEEIQITSMMAADGAQAVNGKLYVLGGGFDRIFLAPDTHGHRFDVAMLINVPWNATNRQFRLIIELLDADGESSGSRAEADMEAGRPPGMRQGTSINVPMAIPIIGEFRKPGRHVVRATIDGIEKARLGIEVTALPLRMAA